MTSLAWYLRNPVDAEMVDVLTKVVRTIGETDETELPAETIHAAALAGLATGDESWRLDADAFGSAVPVIDIGDTQNQRQRYQRGFTPLIRSRLPFTRFHGLAETDEARGAQRVRPTAIPRRVPHVYPADV